MKPALVFHQWKIWLCLFAVLCSFCAEPLSAVIGASGDTSETAYLFMISAATRLTGENPPAVASTSSSPGLLPVRWQLPQQKLTPNEWRTLSDYYLDFAAKLPAGHPLISHFSDKSLQSLEKANQLDRARRRHNNPFRRFFRAVTWPALKVAQGVGWSVKKGVQYLQEVGPEIIREMLQNYLSSGTPFTAKVFWKAVGKRLKTAITNEATARLAAALNPASGKSAATPMYTVSPEVTPTTSSTEPVLFGSWQVNLALPAQTDTYGYMVSDFYLDYPFDRHLVDPYDWAGPVGYWQETTLPLTLDLDQEKVSGTFHATGLGPEAELVYERSTASYQATIDQGWIRAGSEPYSWEIGGSALVNLHIEDELRCWYNPDDPLIGGYFVWVPQTGDWQLRIPISGYILFDPQTEQAYLSFSMEGAAEEDDTVFLFTASEETLLPAEFPIP